MVRLAALLVCLICLASTTVRASEPLRIGLAGEEPFIKKGPPFTGVAVDVWEKIAALNSWTFTYTPFGTMDEGLEAVISGKVDVLVGNVGITKERLERVEFSQPFFRGGFQIMVPEARPHSVARLGQDLMDIFKLEVFWYVAGAVVLFTVLVFIFERRHNPDFPKTRREGLAEAFYYVISLALTGKSTYKGFPGVLGRLVMVAWMILGIITVAYVTSSITSSMTLEKMGNRIAGPEDLPGKTVAVVKGSTAQHYLQEKGITILPETDIASAVDAMLKNKAAAVVDDAPVLQSFDFNHPQLPITEVGPIFAPQNYGFGFAIGSPLRLPLNEALLDLNESRTLAGIFHAYFGSVYQP